MPSQRHCHLAGTAEGDFKNRNIPPERDGGNPGRGAEEIAIGGVVVGLERDCCGQRGDGQRSSFG